MKTEDRRPKQSTKLPSLEGLPRFGGGLGVGFFKIENGSPSNQ